MYLLTLLVFGANQGILAYGALILLLGIHFHTKVKNYQDHSS